MPVGLVDICASSHLTWVYVVEETGGTFQIRPHKDFTPVKGRDRLLSLGILSELPRDSIDELPNSDPDADSEPRSVYDFMRRRKEVGIDPTMQKWNASIRLANYASIENAPLCVSPSPRSFYLRC